MLIGVPGCIQNVAGSVRKAPSTQALGIPPNRAFPWGQPLGAQREASPTRLGKERETPRHFVARAITSRHRPTSAISLSSHSSSHSPLPNHRTISLPPPTAPTEEALLPRRFLALSSRRPCLASKGGKHLAAHQPPPAKCR